MKSNLYIGCIDIIIGSIPLYCPVVRMQYRLQVRRPSIHALFVFNTSISYLCVLIIDIVRSFPEYVFAYMIPIVAGVVLTGADEASTFVGAAIIAITNLLIHTPQLEEYVWFWAFVSTHDHLEHHRKLKGNYGAPVFHVDRIVRRLSTGSLHESVQNEAKLK